MDPRQIIDTQVATIIANADRYTHGLPIDAAARMTKSFPNIVRFIDFADLGEMRHLQTWKEYSRCASPICELMYFDPALHHEKHFLRVFGHDNITATLQAFPIRMEPQMLDTEVAGLYMCPSEDIRIPIGIAIPKPTYDVSAVTQYLHVHLQSLSSQFPLLARQI